jgi:LmbE family N-acetylglucosaminyl deacetylase
MTDILSVLVFGAHPDDPDFKAGGVAALYSQFGHRVKMVSLTNGDAGHHEMGGAPLAWRRRQEAAASGACLGCEYVTLDNHDGALLPTLEVRHQVIDVQDALYMVTVPNVVSRVPHLRSNPVAVYLWDRFQKPYPFTPDIVVSIDDVVERKVDALHCHTSQVYEWLPYNRGALDQVPADPARRRPWLREVLEPRLCRLANLYRDRLIALYGEQRGRQIRYAEAFEVCEYGAPLTDTNRERLFPFF